MTPNARLRDGLRTYASDLERTTATISPDEVRRDADSPRLVRKRNAWPYAVAGFASALAIALIILLVSGLLGEGGETPTSAGSVRGGPEEVLALTADGRLVSMRAEDGREVRVV